VRQTGEEGVEHASTCPVGLQQGVFVRILTPEESFYQVSHAHGQWYKSSAVYLRREDAETLALNLITEIHPREKDSPNRIELLENNTVIRRWTKLDKDTWKEWLIDGKA